MISNSDLTFLREAETCWRKIAKAKCASCVNQLKARQEFKNSVAVHLRVNPRLAAYMWVITHDRFDDVAEHAKNFSYASRAFPVEKNGSRVLMKEPQDVLVHNVAVLTEFLNFHRYRSVTVKRLVPLKLSLR